MSDLPVKKFKKGDLDRLKDTAELECFELLLEKIMVDPQHGTFLLLTANNKMVRYEVDSFAATMISFERAGCGEHPVIPTCYDTNLELIKIMGMTPKKVTVECKQGDMFYARIQFETRNHKIFLLPCSFADALLYSYKMGVKLYIAKPVLDAMEPVDDYPREDEIYDL